MHVVSSVSLSLFLSLRKHKMLILAFVSTKLMLWNFNFFQLFYIPYILFVCYKHILKQYIQFSVDHIIINYIFAERHAFQSWKLIAPLIHYRNNNLVAKVKVSCRMHDCLNQVNITLNLLNGLAQLSFLEQFIINFKDIT
jgi:hypothetical protein